MKRAHSRQPRDERLTRRTVLGIAGVGVLGAIAGCLGDDDSISFTEPEDGETPEPISIPEEASCDECGMVITHHQGPSGQAFYDDEIPIDRDGPALFCANTCLYTWVFDRVADGTQPVVLYSTDYSAFDWDLSTEDDVTFIESNFDASTQRDVTALSFVVGSAVRGAMGEELIGFSDDADAEAFQDTHGGEVLSHESVSRDVLDSLAS